MYLICGGSFLGGGGCREATVDEAAEYLARSLHWAHLMRMTLEMGWHEVHRALGAKGSPAAVMSIVFGGAPIVNAVVALLMHPPAGGWSALRWQFFLGIALAAIGGCLVTLYKPPPPKAAAAVVSDAK